jgi:hypothetical protein
MKLTVPQQIEIATLLHYSIQYEESFIDALSDSKSPSDLQATKLAEKNIANAKKWIDKFVPKKPKVPGPMKI